MKELHPLLFVCLVIALTWAWNDEILVGFSKGYHKDLGTNRQWGSDPSAIPPSMTR